jgi:hypothetical protein
MDISRLLQRIVYYLWLVLHMANAVDRLTLIANIPDVVNQLLRLSKERMAARSTRTAPIFQPGDLFYLSTKGLHIRSQKCKHFRDSDLEIRNWVLIKLYLR